MSVKFTVGKHRRKKEIKEEKRIKSLIFNCLSVVYIKRQRQNK